MSDKERLWELLNGFGLVQGDEIYEDRDCIFVETSGKDGAKVTGVGGARFRFDEAGVFVRVEIGE